jgi:hypothetical protein
MSFLPTIFKSLIYPEFENENPNENANHQIEDNNLLITNPQILNTDIETNLQNLDMNMNIDLDINTNPVQYLIPSQSSEISCQDNNNISNTNTNCVKPELQSVVSRSKSYDLDNSITNTKNSNITFLYRLKKIIIHIKRHEFLGNASKIFLDFYPRVNYIVKPAILKNGVILRNIIKKEHIFFESNELLRNHIDALNIDDDCVVEFNEEHLQYLLIYPIISQIKDAID